MGVNKFAAHTTEEFKQFYRGHSQSMSATFPAARADLSSHVSVDELPAAVDWRTKNPSVVTVAKDQGGCGSCWAFRCHFRAVTLDVTGAFSHTASL